ncbi:MAG: 4-hydroxy-tetrahydrodipicolinate synthase, partial [Actinobacteria bacterium]|nr:4-hydroxy-tetrahydrodipicolinate synthase [Actinomycetota bacterium]
MSEKHKDLFGQVLVALVTPMTPDGEVDWAATEKHLDYVISNGADGVVVTGTTGETSTLTDAEKLQLVKVGKSVSAGRAKIITGGGSNETAHAMQLYKASEAAGADGVMIVTPYYNKPTQAGVLTHFRMIADATDLPVILYDIPGRTGIPIQFETILRAAKHPNIVAIKDAKGDFAQVSRVLNETDLLYFSGDDSNVLPHISLGATGLIGVTANIAPKAYRDLVDATNRNDFDAALKVHNDL